MGQLQLKFVHFIYIFIYRSVAASHDTKNYLQHKKDKDIKLRILYYKSQPIKKKKKIAKNNKVYIYIYIHIIAVQLIQNALQNNQQLKIIQKISLIHLHLAIMHQDQIQMLTKL